MKLLIELNQISNLTDAQKTVLVMANFSATPKQAYAATTGSDKLVYARDSLARIGFISMMSGQVSLTPAGQDAVVQYNLSDETGQPTDEAVELLHTANADDETTDQIPQ
jgi:hypothetical protein